MRTHILRTLAILAFGALSLTGCAGDLNTGSNENPASDGGDGTGGSSTTMQPAIPETEISTIEGYKQYEPDTVKIICVEGDAVLYVYKDGVKSAGSGLTRLPEQDDYCEQLQGIEPEAPEQTSPDAEG